MLISKGRGIISAVLALALDIYAFNFIPRNIAIMASRSLSWHIADYVVNFLIFFVVFYLVLSLAAWLIKKVSPKTK
jgi:Mg2+/Co2+ transporter CorB